MGEDGVAVEEAMLLDAAVLDAAVVGTEVEVTVVADLIRLAAITRLFRLGG